MEYTGQSLTKDITNRLLKKYPISTTESIRTLFYKHNRDIDATEKHLQKIERVHNVKSRLRELASKYNIHYETIRAILYEKLKVSYKDATDQDLDNLDIYCSNKGIGTKGIIAARVRHCCRLLNLEYGKAYSSTKNYLKTKNINFSEIKSEEELKVIDHYLKNEYLNLRPSSRFKFKFDEKDKFRNFREYYESLNTDFSYDFIKHAYSNSNTKEEFLEIIDKADSKKKSKDFVMNNIYEIAKKYNIKPNSIIHHYINNFLGLSIYDFSDNPELFTALDMVIEKYKLKKK